MKSFWKDLRRVTAITCLTLGVLFFFILEFGAVQGDSMHPTLRDKDIILSDKVSPKLNKLKPGDIVNFVSPTKKYSIKRVTKIDSNGVYVLGDNPLVSLDSRNYGLLDKKVIESKVLAVLWPPTRFQVFN